MKRNRTIATQLLMTVALATGCGTVRSFLAADSENGPSKPIGNPFAGYHPDVNGPRESMIFRTKKGDGAVEVEIPRSQSMSEFVIPIASNVNHGRSPASESPAAAPAEPALDSAYGEREPGLSDREITRTFPQGMAEDDARRREIEAELGLVRSEDMTPEKQKSYLAAIDHVKQLYRNGRFEAAILEVDDLVREYPTNPKLYQMRGTLLDRLGQQELALKSWKQALRFDPKNESLRRFIDRKEQKRSLASP